MSRRVLKISHGGTETRRFIYDGWNLVQETVSTASGVATNHYVWGKDLSGSMQGAGGVGGLLAVSLNGTWHFPFYDNNGNITAYVDESGSVVAEYAYDAFGATIAQTGPMADAFPHRFSTKYFDSETGLYYYGYRYYAPELMRWLNRDSIEEKGGLNLYIAAGNQLVDRFDFLGMAAFRVFYMSRKSGNYVQATDWSKIEQDIKPMDISSEPAGTFKPRYTVIRSFLKRICAVHVFLDIGIDPSVSDSEFPSGTIVLYSSHAGTQDKVQYELAALIPNRRAPVLAHELGHAYSWWQNVKPQAQQIVQGMSGWMSDDSATKSLKSLNAENLFKSGKIADDFTLRWFKSNGYTIESLPRRVVYNIDIAYDHRLIPQGK